MRRFGVPLLLVLLMIVGMPAAVADDLDDQLDEVTKEIDDLKDDIAAAEGRRSGLADQILASDARLTELVEDLARANLDLAAVTIQVQDTRDDLELTRAELEAQYQALEVTRIDLIDTREQAQERALRIYMSGGEDSSAAIFGVGDLTEVGVGVEYASQVMESTDQLLNGLAALEVQAERQAEIIERQKQRLQADVDVLEARRAQAAALSEVVESRKVEVEAELANQRALLARVKADIAHFEEELDGLEAEQARIEQLIKDAQEQEPPGPAPSGVFARPVPGPITSPFGPRRHPILGYVRMHTGVDMSAGSGTPIKAAEAGNVIHASGFGGYGNTVIIAHGGGLSTLYAHQSRVAVRAGDSVARGEVIGYVGSTGLSTGPHLHFEVRRNGSPIDPAPFL